MTQPGNANQAVINEANTDKRWFHARKTRPICARRLEHEQTVKTLEGDEVVPAGTFLCRGEAGDIWPQSAERLAAKYEATDEIDRDGWRKYVPHSDNQGVMAAQMSQPFVVQAKWGKLRGKPGDYLVKNYEDLGVAHPEDVWVVDQQLFDARYERVAESP